MKKELEKEIYKTEYSSLSISYCAETNCDNDFNLSNIFENMVAEYKGYIDFINPKMKINTLKRQIHILDELLVSTKYKNNVNFCDFLINEIKGRKDKNYKIEYYK